VPGEIHANKRNTVLKILHRFDHFQEKNEIWCDFVSRSYEAERDVISDWFIMLLLQLCFITGCIIYSQIMFIGCVKG